MSLNLTVVEEKRRKQTPRRLTIDYDACAADEMCVHFCAHDVLQWDEAHQRPVVANPYHCVDGCQACVQVCPVEAIRLPAREALRRAVPLRARAS